MHGTAGEEARRSAAPAKWVAMRALSPALLSGV